VATNNGGSDTIVKTGYITCTTAQVPVVDFEADNNTIMQGESVNFTDLSTNDPDTWHWTFDGGTPETSTEQNPQGIVYPEGGSYNVKLVASNEAGSDSLIKEEYIHVNWVGIGEFDGPHDFHIFPNPGNGLFVVEFATTGNTPATIEVVDSFGKLIRKYPVTKSDKHITLDLKALSNGNYFIKLNDGIKTVTRQITIVK
jgi:PKD repeat protein